MLSSFYMDKSIEKKERGQRIITLRKQLGLSRRAFAEKYSLSENTLKAWEHALQNGLSEKGAKMLVHIFRREGLPCSLEWLMSGRQLPINYVTKTDKELFAHLVGSKETIEKEIAAYRSIHPKLIYTTVEDDALLPHFAVGDVVAGVPVSQKDFALAIGHLCIVETDKERQLVRRVLPGTRPNLYHLGCTNMQSSNERPFIYDAGLISVAPINWHRKLFLPT